MADPPKKALSSELVTYAYILLYIALSSGQVFFKKIYTLGRKVWTAKGDTHAEAKKELISSLKLLEAELGDKPYFGGNTMGITDIALIPYYSWFYTFEKFGNLCMNDECPKLVAWGERCLQRESVSTSLCDQYATHDFILGLRKRIGVE